jgi:hypothetical protein
VSQNEKYFEGFLKVAHENLLGMACRYHAWEFIVESLENLVFGSWMHEKYSLSVQNES